MTRRAGPVTVTKVPPDPPRPDRWHTIVAKKPGACCACPAPVKVGDTVRYNPARRRCLHLGCLPPDPFQPFSKTLPAGWRSRINTRVEHRCTTCGNPITLNTRIYTHPATRTKRCTSCWDTHPPTP